MADAKAIGYLELNIAGFENAIKSAQKIFAGFVAGFASFEAAKHFASATKSAIDFGNQMYIAGQKTGGFQPGQLLLVQKALERAGLSAGEARGKINEFVESGRDIQDIFKGSAGYSAAMQQVSKDFGSQASILNRSAEQFSVVYDTLGSIGEKLKTFFLAGTEQFLKPLEAVLEAINSIDLAGIGADFGKAIATAINTLTGFIKNGTFFSTIQLGLEVAFKTAVNYLVGGAQTFAQILDVSFRAAATAFASVIESLTNAPWGAVVKVIIGEFGQLGVFLVKMFLNAGAYLAAANETAVAKLLDALPPKVKEFLNAGSMFSTDYDSNLKSGRAQVDGALSGVSDEGKKMVADNQSAVTSFFKQAGEGAASAFEKVVGGSKISFEAADLFPGLKDESQRLGEAFKSAREVGEQAAASVKDKKPGVNYAALEAPQPFHVIADSLAKIGGGGNFIRVGQNLLEREAVKQTRAAEQSAKALDAINGKLTGDSVIMKRE